MSTGDGMLGVAQPRWRGERLEPPTRLARLASAVTGALTPVPARRMQPWAWAVLAVQAAVLVAMLFVHSRWEDEAQAWLLARDDSPWNLLARSLRYEGSPGLWQFLLMPFAKLGFPYVTIGILSGLAALVGSYLWLRFSPFPPLVRALLPLSYYVLYQYGVVARSYALLAPLLFAVVILLPRWRQRPLTLMVLLCLLANVSVHGLLIALGLVAASLPAAHRGWPQLDARLRRRHLLAGVLGVVVLAGLVAVLWPPADLAAGTRWTLNPLHVAATTPLYLVHSVAVNVVSLLVLLVSGLWLWRHRALRFLVLPAGAICTLFAVKYFSVWHEGTLALVWVAALWIGVTRSRRGRPVRVLTSNLRGEHWTAAMSASLGVALLIQVGWSVQSLTHELTHPYSSSSAVAAYLRSRNLASQVEAVFYPGVAILPYFSKAEGLRMANRATTYWVWSVPEVRRGMVQQVVARGSPYVLLPVKVTGGAVPCLSGYRIVAGFPGSIYYKNRAIENDAAVLLQRVAGWTGREPADPGTCARIPAGEQLQVRPADLSPRGAD